MYYLDAIKNFKSDLAQEIKDKEFMLMSEDFKVSPLLRENVIVHYSASSMIFNHNFTKVLMAYHNIYQTFSWTGGHVDNETDFLSVALKEACEETGLNDFHVLSEDVISLECLPVCSHIKRGEFVSSHIHMNLTYAFQHFDEKAPLIVCSGENSAVEWIKIEDLKNKVTEKEMLVIYDKIISRVIKIHKD